MRNQESEGATVCHQTAYFSGRVQGVGFRYQVLQLAKGFEVGGYVQNLSDGRVLLEAEGAEAEVTDFVAAIDDDLNNYIKSVERETGSRKQEFFGFTIR